MIRARIVVEFSSSILEERRERLLALPRRELVLFRTMVEDSWLIGNSGGEAWKTAGLERLMETTTGFRRFGAVMDAVDRAPSEGNTVFGSGVAVMLNCRCLGVLSLSSLRQWRLISGNDDLLVGHVKQTDLLNSMI